MNGLDFYKYEQQHAAIGEFIAGADEAGRGPLAGPVVAAAVIMPCDDWVEGIADSKKLSEKKREMLYLQIIKKAVAYGVGISTVEEIEKYNILNATRMAFARAIELLPQPFALYTDYITGLEVDMPYTPFVKGDAQVYSIAAASIIAKVSRDKLMREYDEKYPAYGFAKHKGYGTKVHTEAILQNGPCPIHRISFLGKILHGQI